mmetsp:Transcript_95209/g.226704  ORF Transcript_95209/g.226704 Transcript_95209/m.226704 type:complete len:358 (-) Transcript_95209:86-1159(-)
MPKLRSALQCSDGALSKLFQAPLCSLFSQLYPADHAGTVFLHHRGVDAGRLTLFLQSFIGIVSPCFCCFLGCCRSSRLHRQALRNSLLDFRRLCSQSFQLRLALLLHVLQVFGRVLLHLLFLSNQRFLGLSEGGSSGRKPCLGGCLRLLVHFFSRTGPFPGCIQQLRGGNHMRLLCTLESQSFFQSLSCFPLRLFQHDVGLPYLHLQSLHVAVSTASHLLHRALCIRDLPLNILGGMISLVPGLVGTLALELEFTPFEFQSVLLATSCELVLAMLVLYALILLQLAVRGLVLQDIKPGVALQRSDRKWLLQSRQWCRAITRQILVNLLAGVAPNKVWKSQVHGTLFLLGAILTDLTL